MIKLIPENSSNPTAWKKSIYLKKKFRTLALVTQVEFPVGFDPQID